MTVILGNGRVARVDVPQLPLPFPQIVRVSAQSVVWRSPSNAAALTWLERISAWPNGQLLLWGEAASGKTHLLRAWAERADAVFERGPDLLGVPRLTGARGVAIDDADAAADEIVLLHLLNAAREADLPTLLASRSPPSRWPTRLPDLATRLRAITVVEIAAPDDELLQVVLARSLAERQLSVPEAVQQWLLRRLPRTPAALHAAVARLETAVWASGSAITRALAANALADMIGPRADEISESTRGPSQKDPPLL